MLAGRERVNCHGIENLPNLFENRCPIALEGGETPIAYCSLRIESLRFDQCFRPCSRHFATIKLHKVQFTYTSSAGRTARKITKNNLIFQSLTRILMIQIREVALVLLIFKSGNFFLAQPAFQ